MALQMPRLLKRKGSSNHQPVQRIPADILGKVIGFLPRAGTIMAAAVNGVPPAAPGKPATEGSDTTAPATSPSSTPPGPPPGGPLNRSTA